MRVDDLIARMTLKEKIGPLNLPCAYVKQLGTTGEEKMEAARKFVAGTYTNEIGPGSGLFTLADTIRIDETKRQVEYFNELQRICADPDAVEDLSRTKKVRMVRCSPGRRFFRKGCRSAAHFDLPLVKESLCQGDARSSGIHILSTLVLETDRDPRMGRNMEAYTEDPYLYSRIAENIVRGAQGTNVNASDKVVALMTDFPRRASQSAGWNGAPSKSQNKASGKISCLHGLRPSRLERWR